MRTQATAKSGLMDSKNIIMNFSVPPTAEDLLVMASEILDNMPDELVEFAGDIAVVCEEIPDEALEQELDLDDPFDLLALYRSGAEISPGVQKKIADEDDALMLFRRPILDMWCETGEDLYVIMRAVVIEEIARYHDFADHEIETIIKTHHQGLL